jgi:hypothetical protein
MSVIANPFSLRDSSTEAEERKDGHQDDDHAHEINNAVHGRAPFSLRLKREAALSAVAHALDRGSKPRGDDECSSKL